MLYIREKNVFAVEVKWSNEIKNVKNHHFLKTSLQKLFVFK